MKTIPIKKTITIIPVLFLLLSTATAKQRQAVTPDSTAVVAQRLAKVSVYPSPTNDVMYISITEQLQNAILTVVNMNGQTVLTDSSVSGNNITLNVSGLTKGSYIVRIDAEKDQVLTSKFTKNK